MNSTQNHLSMNPVAADVRRLTLHWPLLGCGLLGATLALSLGSLAAAAENGATPLLIKTHVASDEAGRQRLQLVLSNPAPESCSAEVEYLVQQDPSLYSKPAPRPGYGRDLALGVRSWGGDERQPAVESNDVWGRSNGRLRSINAMTAGRPWNTFGTVWRKQTEAFGYVDLGQVVSVTHMTYDPSDSGMAWKVDFATSLDGQQYKPVEGLKGVNLHRKTEPVEISVPKFFQARFIQMRLNNDGGEPVNAFRYPRQFHVYAGETADTWAFPQVGPVADQGKLTRSVPGRGGSVVFEIGQARSRVAGAYLVAVRIKSGGGIQMCYEHLFVMPAPLTQLSFRSPFGINASDLKDLPTAKLAGNTSVHYENLRWPAVSPAAGVYQFDGGGSGINQDAFLRACHAAGLSVLPCLSGTPSYLRPAATNPPAGDPEALPPTDFSKFAEFVFQTVVRYGRQQHPAAELRTADKVSGLGYAEAFELWNEPNTNARGASKWKGSLDDYYRLFRLGAEAVKKADPRAKVANGGWWGVEIPLLDTMRTTQYPDGKCPLDFTDILSVHHWSSMGDIGSAYGIEPELATVYDLCHHHEGVPYDRTIEDDLRALAAWRDARKPGLPIWLTEAAFDRGNINERLQACWLPRGVMMARAAGVDQVQILPENGGGVGGLMRNDGSLKPAWFTYATLVRQLDGLTGPALRLPSGDDNVRAYLWQRRGQALVTAWVIKGSGELKIPLGRCTVTDAFGASRPAELQTSLPLSEFPLYISALAEPSVVRTLEAQGKQFAQQQQRRLDRQARLQAYLFRFGLKNREAYLCVGSLRRFTPVLAADLYDASKGFGFETKGLSDQSVPWFQNPITDTEVRATTGTRFTFKAAPGQYLLRLCARASQPGQARLLGLEEGEPALQIPAEGLIATTTIRVGPKPATLEMASPANLVWMAVTEVDPEVE